MGCASSSSPLPIQEIKQTESKKFKEEAYIHNTAANKRWDALRIQLLDLASSKNERLSLAPYYIGSSGIHGYHTILYFMLYNECPEDIYDLYFQLNPDMEGENEAFDLAIEKKNKLVITFYMKHFKPTTSEKLLTREDNLDIARHILNSKECPVPVVIMLGDLSELSARLSKGTVDVNKLMDNGKTPILTASDHDHNDIILQLLQSGAVLDSNTSDGEAIFINFAHLGYVEMVTAMLDSGVNINSKSKRTFINYPSNINIQQGDTALIAASRNGKSFVVRMLIASGADYMVCNDSGESAVSVGKTEHIKNLIRSDLVIYSSIYTVFTDY